MHGKQRPLGAELEELWLAALADAGFSSDEALLYIFDGEKSQAGYAGWHFPRGLWIHPNPDLPEFDPLLDELNDDEIIGCVRIAIWKERTPEGQAALIRHELEHAKQLEALGTETQELYGLAVAVLAERVGGLAGGGLIYTTIPVELDANAAAATFARARFGDARIDQLLTDKDENGALFRSLVSPPEPETLPERMLAFFLSYRDLCDRYAQRQGFEFWQLLDLHWRGAGAAWRSATADDSSFRLPRREDPWEMLLGPKLPEASRAVLDAHIRDLCAQHQLEWRQDAATWRNAEASLEERWISAPALERELDYWAAIHEVGHFATGDLPTEDERRKILWENEEAVWNWALDNALVSPSGAARGLIYSSFFSYEDDAAPDELRARARARIGEGGDDPMVFKQ